MAQLGGGGPDARFQWPKSGMSSLRRSYRILCGHVAGLQAEESRLCGEGLVFGEQGLRLNDPLGIVRIALSFE